MRKVKIFYLIFLLFCTFVNMQAYAFSKIFTQENFAQLKQQNFGQQWLMILWSVDCPACFKELALIQKVRQQHPDILIAIINADDSIDIGIERERIITSYQLQSVPNYHFSEGQGNYSRFLIDNNWYGELPRSYFIDVMGKFHGKSGLIEGQMVKKWLVEQSK